VVKVGDRVVVYGWPFPVYVSRIYWQDRNGVETDVGALRTLTMLELDWAERGKSRVKLHDEGLTWYRYSETN
jgi:hypothetical protein